MLITYLIYPNKKNISGPLLFSEEKIFELDNIISKVWEKMERCRDDTIKSIVAEELARYEDKIEDHREKKKIEDNISKRITENYLLDSDKRKITVFFKNDSKVIDDSFKSIKKRGISKKI